MSKKFQQFAHEEFDRAVLSSARFINFCKASGINHLGHAGPPNFGLLNRLREGDLDRLQLALFAWNPAFFEFSFSREGVLPRLLRAQGVARVVAAAHDNRLVHAICSPLPKGSRQEQVMLSSTLGSRIQKKIW